MGGKGHKRAIVQLTLDLLRTRYPNCFNSEIRDRSRSASLRICAMRCRKKYRCRFCTRHWRSTSDIRPTWSRSRAGPYVLISTATRRVWCSRMRPNTRPSGWSVCAVPRTRDLLLRCRYRRNRVRHRSPPKPMFRSSDSAPSNYSSSQVADAEMDSPGSRPPLRHGLPPRACVRTT